MPFMSLRESEEETRQEQEEEEKEEDVEEEEDVEASGTARVVIPQDGYEWRKYGHKYIKNIGKWRSYYKCQRQNCTAKKKVEWSSGETDNIRVVYDGRHSHASSSSEGTSNANQYDLLSQVLRRQTTSSSSSSSSSPTLPPK